MNLLFYGKAGGGWVGNNRPDVTNFATSVRCRLHDLTGFTTATTTSLAAGWSALA